MEKQTVNLNVVCELLGVDKEELKEITKKEKDKAELRESTLSREN